MTWELFGVLLASPLAAHFTMPDTTKLAPHSQGHTNNLVTQTLVWDSHELAGSWGRCVLPCRSLTHYWLSAPLTLCLWTAQHIFQPAFFTELNAPYLHITYCLMVLSFPRQCVRCCCDDKKIATWILRVYPCFGLCCFSFLPLRRRHVHPSPLR